MRKVCFDCNFETVDNIDSCPKCGRKLFEKRQGNNILSALDTWPASRFFYIGLLGYLFSFLRFIFSVLVSMILDLLSFGYSDFLFLVGFVAILFGKKFYRDDRKINLLFWIYIISIVLFVFLTILIVVGYLDYNLLK